MRECVDAWMRKCVNAFPAPPPGWMRTLGAGKWGIFTVHFSRFTSSQALARRTVGISPLRLPRLGPGFTPVEMTVRAEGDCLKALAKISRKLSDFLPVLCMKEKWFHLPGQFVHIQGLTGIKDRVL